MATERRKGKCEVYDTRIRPVEQPLLSAAIEHALKGRELVALTLGETRCYLHRDIVEEVFALETKPATVARVTLEDVAPVYRPSQCLREPKTTSVQEPCG